jgi:aspartate racemase
VSAGASGLGGRTAGVLGGMGPEATVDFLTKVLRASGAEKDQDHIRVIVDINPQIPDRNIAIAEGSRAPGEALARMALGLERAGADFLVMPCNTAHAFQADIERATRLPFLSIIDETVAAVRRVRPQTLRAGLLATSGCLAAGLYDRALASVGIQTLVLGNAALERFMALLYRIKAGDRGNEVRSTMRELALSLQRDGAEIIVSGCTEVPLVLDLEVSGVTSIDSTVVLAERTVAYARGVVAS